MPAMLVPAMLARLLLCLAGDVPRGAGRCAGGQLWRHGGVAVGAVALVGRGTRRQGRWRLEASIRASGVDLHESAVLVLGYQGVEGGEEDVHPVGANRLEADLLGDEDQLDGTRGRDLPGLRPRRDQLRTPVDVLV